MKGTLPYIFEVLWHKKLLGGFGLMQILYPEEYGEVWSLLTEQELNWEKSSSKGSFDLYQVEVGENVRYLKINAIEDDPRYTLSIEDVVILSFETLPADWQLTH